MDSQWEQFPDLREPAVTVEGSMVVYDGRLYMNVFDRGKAQTWTRERMKSHNVGVSNGMIWGPNYEPLVTFVHGSVRSRHRYQLRVIDKATGRYLVAREEGGPSKCVQILGKMDHFFSQQAKNRRADWCMKWFALSVLALATVAVVMAVVFWKHA
jgi:hypothetical protein